MTERIYKWKGVGGEDVWVSDSVKASDVEWTRPVNQRLLTLDSRSGVDRGNDGMAGRIHGSAKSAME